MTMKETLDKIVGLTVATVEVNKAYDGMESSFCLTFTDRTILYVSSHGFNNGTSIATVDIE